MINVPGRMLRNRAQCANCKEIIESVHRHDFMTCSCYSNTAYNTGIYIDGGIEYQRVGGNHENFIDLSIWDQQPDDQI